MSNKLLALNIPTNFLRHVEYARLEIIDSMGASRFERDAECCVEKRYRRCLGTTNEAQRPLVAMRLLEIECRFVALLRTVDQSVPVAPLFKKYSYLSRNVGRSFNSEADHTYVAKSLGYDDIEKVPHSLDDFKNASTLAEKALIAELMVQNFSQTLNEVASHFDYKRRMFGRGASRTYSLVYAVLALAVEFEAYNHEGRPAAVTVSADGSRHEGPFLDFVTNFVYVVDAGTIGLRPTDGFNERVRKIAQKRSVDPEMVAVLDQFDVDADAMLNFLERADALKS